MTRVAEVGDEAGGQPWTQCRRRRLRGAGGARQHAVDDVDDLARMMPMSSVDDLIVDGGRSTCG